jgi:hypothetical protein
MPDEAWALLIALVLVGVAPNVKWITMIEDQLRRVVHAWYLVPDGVLRTIGVLDDAKYEPPVYIINELSAPDKERIKTNLTLPPSSVYYRWARATMLFETLKQIGGDRIVLRSAQFEPFEEDLDRIRARYRELGRDIDRLQDHRDSRESNREDLEEALANSVYKLLRQIYAYLSWGIRQQATSERDVDQILEELGFYPPDTYHQRVLDAMLPAAFFVAVISFAYWLIVRFFPWNTGLSDSSLTPAEEVLSMLCSATAASFMYGYAAFIALRQRSSQIEENTWSQYSARSYFPIVAFAGAVSWAVIVVSTVLFAPGKSIESLIGMSRLLAGAQLEKVGDWSFLLIKLSTALPWFLAGATASTLLAWRLAGDVRRTALFDQLRDAIVVGVGLGIAAAVAQCIQLSLADFLVPNAPTAAHLDYWHLMTPCGGTGLAGLACGVVLGLMVPRACRLNIIRPLFAGSALELNKLRTRAKDILNTEELADRWVFTPQVELGGITPAEAIQYRTRVNGVSRILEKLNLKSAEPDPREVVVLENAVPLRKRR